MDKFEELKNIILGLPGHKYIVLSTLDATWTSLELIGTQINKQGKFSGVEISEQEFWKRLQCTFLYGGYLIIRQFLPVTLDNRQLQNVYAVYFENNDWYPVSKAKVEADYSVRIEITDAFLKKMNVPPMEPVTLYSEIKKPR